MLKKNKTRCTQGYQHRVSTEPVVNNQQQATQPASISEHLSALSTQVPGCRWMEGLLSRHYGNCANKQHADRHNAKGASGW